MDATKVRNDHGLLVDPTTDPPTCYGYIFNFGKGHGAFSPGAHLGELTQEEIDTHNTILAKAEFEAMMKAGRGMLYLVERNGALYVNQWSNGREFKVDHWKKSFHNFAGRNGRTDVWFHIGQELWHGVNIGDNQMCRVKRNKQVINNK